MILTVWIVSALPWLIGAGVGYRLAVCFKTPMGGGGVFIAAGGLAGYLVFAGLLFSADALFAGVFQHGMVATLSALGISLAIALHGLTRNRAGSSIEREHTGFFMLPMVYLAVIFYITTILPPSGWDSLWYWSYISSGIIDHTDKGPFAAWYYDEGHPHPHTVATIAAWSTGIRNYFDVAGPVYAPWFYVYLSCCGAVAAHIYNQTRDKLYTLAVGLCFASTPLLENHIMIGGYAEIFLLASVVSATSIATIGLQNKCYKTIALAAVFAVSCCAYKNIGFIVTTCMFVAFGICVLQEKFGFKKTFKFLAPGSLLALLVFTVCVLNTGIEINLAGRNLQLQVANISEIPKNQLFAFFINNSFGLAAALLILGFSQYSSRAFAGHTCLSLYVALILFSALSLAQLSTYGFNVAVPENDTGNSRMSLILIGALFLGAGPLYRLATDD